MFSTKVLWLARGMPWPLDSGDKIYTARLAKALAAAGVPLTFMALVEGEGDPIAALSKDSRVKWLAAPGAPRGTVRSALSLRPLVGARYSPPEYVAAVRQELTRNSYGAIILDQYAMMWVLEECADLLRDQRPVIVHVSHDFETDVTAMIARDYRGNPLNKVALHLNALKTARAERMLTRQSDLMTVVTEEDATQFARIGSRRPPVVIHPGYSGPRDTTRRISADTPRRVLVLGSYLWIAKQMNLAAFLEAADPIFAQHGVGVDIVGTAPEPFMRDWGPKLQAITLHGFVPDLERQLDSVRMGLVIESTGGGFKLKTLQYIFSRLPVGAIDGSLNGMPAEIRSHFIVEPNAAALAEAVCGVIDDVARLNGMQEGAFDLSRDLFDWDRNGRDFASALQACIEEKARKAHLQ